MDKTKRAANPSKSPGRASNKHFWNWDKDEESATEGGTGVRTLYLDGTIADESWWDDDITPRMFKDELMSGDGDIVVWINSPGGDCIAASQIYTMLMDYPHDVTIKIDGWRRRQRALSLWLERRCSWQPTSCSGFTSR
jgi:ATP-dependent Clp protease protease subunit